MKIINDQYYMEFALQIASIANGQTSINPLVGCVLVKNGEIVGFGAHLKRGEAHAEVQALRMAGEKAKDSTAYVTLEPCCHFGKTPPCVDQLIHAGIKRVVVAAVDPNPLVAGKGIAKLKANGIEVDVGILAEKATKMNEGFNASIVTKLPFVTFKTAMTLDGKIATKTGDSKWISSSQSREWVHTLRHTNQAIMVGIGTVLADNPSLTTRLSVPGLQPIRLVVDSNLRIPMDATLIKDKTAPTWIFTTDHAPIEKEKILNEQGIVVYRCGEGPHVDLHKMMQVLSQLEISSILLEGGGKLAGAMLEANYIHKVAWFIAPKLVGGNTSFHPLQWHGIATMNDAITLEQLSFTQLDNDILIEGIVNYEQK